MNISPLLRYIAVKYPFKKGRCRVSNFTMKHIGGVVLSADRFGNKFLLDLDNCVDANTYLNRYENGVIEHFSRYVLAHKCSAFIDIGSMFGLWTAYFAKSPGIDHVYAFEPDPRNFAQLMSTIFLNDLCDKVEAFNVALSDKRGEAELYLSRKRYSNYMNKYNTGVSSLVFLESMHSRGASVKVATQRLDDHLNMNNRRLAIKIDVEGHELAVLKGAEMIFRNNDCVLCIELWGHGNYFQISDDYLRGLGYKCDGKTGDNYFYIKGPSLT